MGQTVTMLLYSFALAVALAVSAPWWLMRMATTSRYREGLRQRLGAVPAPLIAAVSGKQVVWLHAVSVGEVLAASRLVNDLEAGLGDGWLVVVSTTTRTGQALARERFGASRVFYMPLDFAWAVRRYSQALKPAALVLMESELWPRMLHECSRAGVPVAVVNARVSDRSFSRGRRAKPVWGRVLRKVSLWLAQSEEDGRRLVAMGARAEAVRITGNLKYDVRAPKQSRIAELIREAAAGRPIIVAGSTVAQRSDNELSEDEIVIQAWQGTVRRELGAVLVLAPRHPERFGEVESVVGKFRFARASNWVSAKEDASKFLLEEQRQLEVVLLDTIGDLAAVYGVADVAFVGGSLVKRGGHNPLEPAQFGVPVVMGPSYENFRDVVETMRAVDGIAILRQTAGLSTGTVNNAVSGRDGKFVSLRNQTEALEAAFVEQLTHRDAAKAMGERGRTVFEQQQGATARAVDAIIAMVKR
jgi:3-deoxy-D-manno-octulosonic-acid transferase